MRRPVKGYHQSTEIRRSYEILPFQGVWTWLTGKELPERKEMWQSNSTERVFWSLAWVMLGIVLTSLAVIYVQDITLQILCWVIGALFATSGARYIVATIIHHGVHGHLYKSQRISKALCEILSTIFIVQPYESYRQFHVYEHHGREFSTFEDKDLAAIYQLGFTPGKSKSALYARFIWTLLSPKFHLVFFYGRLKSNLIGVPFYRLSMSLIWLTSLCVIGYFAGHKLTLFVLILPFIILYQMASLVHLLTEHVWLVRKEGESVRDSHINNCLARFCGSACPAGLAPQYWAS